MVRISEEKTMQKNILSRCYHDAPFIWVADVTGWYGLYGGTTAVMGNNYVVEYKTVISSFL